RAALDPATGARHASRDRLASWNHVLVCLPCLGVLPGENIRWSTDCSESSAGMAWRPTCPLDISQLGDAGCGAVALPSADVRWRLETARKPAAAAIAWL